ncbi:arginase [Ureibacillus composti]|nr:arginase [Ureibacillus composti]
MGNSLLSIDWDYFISTENENIVSYVENKRTILDLWYKRYLKAKTIGKNIQNSFLLSSEVEDFWNKIKKVFYFDPKVKVYVSESHALSYEIAEHFQCNEVYLFDAHADLGYGGLASLNFEVNCANWLGQLLKNKKIEKAHIIYSPYTKEKPEYFNQINKKFNVNYLHFNNLNKEIETTAIHICRSGAWSPPWFDQKFKEFVNALGIPYKVIDCPIRHWKPKNLSYADQLQYLMA